MYARVLRLKAMEKLAIDKENIDSAKPEFTDSVLLDKIQIPYWRAHPEVSITSYESRIQIHWNGAYAKSLW